MKKQFNCNSRIKLSNRVINGEITVNGIELLPLNINQCVCVENISVTVFIDIVFE